MATEPDAVDVILVVEDLDGCREAVNVDTLGPFRDSLRTIAGKSSNAQVDGWCWYVSDNRGEGVPREQTLERLLCGACREAYPERASSVQRWLDTRPEPTPLVPKSFAWSYMAGWYAELGHGFHRQIWQDAKLRGSLESLLDACGATQIVATHEIDP